MDGGRGDGSARYVDHKPLEERGRADEIQRAMITDDQWEGQLEVCRRDGTCFPAYVRYQWLRDAERSPTGVIGVSAT